MRRVFRDALGQPVPQFGFEDAWLSLFGDGGGAQFVVDCRDPGGPSMLRDCFRESFAGPDWGKRIAPLATWLTNATEWMTACSCRFDPARVTKPRNPPIHTSPDKG